MVPPEGLGDVVGEHLEIVRNRRMQHSVITSEPDLFNVRADSPDSILDSYEECRSISGGLVSYANRVVVLRSLVAGLDFEFTEKAVPGELLWETTNRLLRKPCEDQPHGTHDRRIDPMETLAP